MNKAQVLKKLAAFGTAQTRKVYARHGVEGAMYGVSYANLGVLKRQIKCDHQLAVQLWSSGNHDARVLATMIADGASMDARTLDAWAKAASNHILTAAVAEVAAASPIAAARAAKWTKAKAEFVSSTGWNLVSRLAQTEEGLPDAVLEKYVAQIEKTIHAAPNRTRYSMNTALIGIGIRNARLKKRALAAAKKIGAVEVDHGETGCKTPDAAAYIAKTMAHRKKKAAKKKTAKKKTAKRKAGNKKTARKKASAARR